jgi:pimeloyl-ACP methyl ester carboxylesterase
MRLRGWAVALTAAAMVLSGCTAAPEPTVTGLGLEGVAACPKIDGFSCGTLPVPLDRSGARAGRLQLRVAVSDNADAPRGVLLFLTGGPGQPGVDFVPRMLQRSGHLLDEYRLVMIDQRGTGADAIDCPKLQHEVGSSDVTPPSPGAVQECADLIGSSRDFYTTADTVADLDDLRAALGVDRWTISGVSYGAFVAARYGLAYPAHAARLVLDSVVPQHGAPALYTQGFARAAFALREACREQGCGYDPAAELAAVVRRHGNGVGVFDLLVTASIVDPQLKGEEFFPVLSLIHQAFGGDVGPLNEAVADLRARPVPVAEFSSGLHAATLCADQADLPWGTPSAPLAGRVAAVEKAVAGLPADAVWPFTRADAGGQGLVQTCVAWPPARPDADVPAGARLTMPVLLLAGDRDLSTPLAWAEAQAKLCDDGELVVVAGAGHSLQGRFPAADEAVRQFLLG